MRSGDLQGHERARQQIDAAKVAHDEWGESRCIVYCHKDKCAVARTHEMPRCAVIDHAEGMRAVGDLAVSTLGIGLVDLPSLQEDCLPSRQLSRMFTLPRQLDCFSVGFSEEDDCDTIVVSSIQAMMHHRYRDVVVNGVRLFYMERDAAKGQNASPILLLHALLATAETLEDLIAGLPADRRIVAIDLLSAQPADRAKELDVHQASLSGLIRDFMRSMGLVKPVLVGHSHGGVLALRLAATDPTALEGVVLMCPAHPFGGYRSHVVNFYLRQPGRMLALSIPLAPSWMILRAYNEAAGSKSRIGMRHLRPHLAVLRNRNTLRRVLEILKTWDEDMAGLREVLTKAEIAVPTLLIWGDEDPVVPIASAAELEVHLADSERVTLVGMGHLMPEEAPEECARFIGDWVARLEARDRFPVPGNA